MEEEEGRRKEGREVGRVTWRKRRRQGRIRISKKEEDKKGEGEEILGILLQFQPIHRT